MDCGDGRAALVVQTKFFFFELSKVKLSHSCILPVTVERMYFFFIPFVFLYFIAFLLSL